MPEPPPLSRELVRQTRGGTNGFRRGTVAMLVGEDGDAGVDMATRRFK